MVGRFPLMALGLSAALTAPWCHGEELVIADKGGTSAVILVSPEAGTWESRAADDLARYIEQMSGAKPAVIRERDAIRAALARTGPQLVVGDQALALEPALAERLKAAAKPNPVLRSDAAAVVRRGNRVLLAGLNDDCHYYAAARLLAHWGCRWYLPTEFGECIPDSPRLAVGELDEVSASPFEVRRYWISWVGDTTGRDEFMRRNYMNDMSVPSGHNLASFVQELIPPGKTAFNVPITADKTAAHVAQQVLAQYREGKDVQLGMEDGLYESDDPLDQELIKLQYDKYFLTQSYTDAFLTFYNKVAEILMREAPQSRARIGFLAYANITLPPVRPIVAKRPLVAYLAPIDIDPIHGMDDPHSKPRREYKGMLYKWSKVMEGRVVIYDYDQGMLVWRDLPNPSHQAFRQDVKHYRAAGVLGVDTESRNAIATTFLNLHLRAQLLWNPDADVDALLAEFYPKFYGPAAEPMRAYWSAIFRAWQETLVTEHEYFVVPAIYTPELIAELQTHLQAAEAAMAPLAAQPARTPRQQQFVDRMAFTRLSFDMIQTYAGVARAAATEGDYAAAVKLGEQGLATREKLTAMNGTFTTYKIIGEHGPAWWPGEVEHYRELLALTNGTKGRRVAQLPLVWALRRDPQNVGAAEQWHSAPVDLTWWRSRTDQGSLASRWENPGAWEEVRCDLYLQAQGLITPEYDGYTGHAWYRAEIDVPADVASQPVKLCFPGLFNRCWLYVNGVEIAERPHRDMWWYNDYRFQWDVDLAGKLKPGKNTIALRIHNPHHFGGMFRRPFLYVPAAP